MLIFTSPAGAGSSDIQALEGSGTAEDPYVITNATELQSIEDDLDAHYVLGKDIDASVTEEWNGGQGFDPIGSDDRWFTGTFDGRKHVIEDLWIHRPNQDYVGLFSVSSGVVENVHLEDADVRSLDWAGTLIGINHGTVRNASASGEITSGDDAVVGGLVGDNEPTDETEAKIIRSSSNVNVTNEDAVTGGLVGSNGGTLTESYSIGNVRGGENVGGLSGRTYGSHEVYSTGSVTATKDDSAGGLTGGEGGSLVEAYWDVETSGQSDGAATGQDGGTGLRTSEMTGSSARETLKGFDFENTWAVTDSYPVLRWQIEGLGIATGKEILQVGNETDVSTQVNLIGDRSVWVTSVADHSSGDESVLSVDGSTVVAESTGESELTASHASFEASTSVLVISPSGISAIGAATNTDEIVAGEPVAVTGTFRNVDENATFHNADLLANGEAVATTNVTVAGNSDAEHTLEWTPQVAGTYNLSIDGIDAGSVTVTEPATATPTATPQPGDDTSGEQSGTEMAGTDAVGTTDDADTNDGGSGGLPLPLLAVGVVAVLATGVLAGRKL